MSPGDPIDGNLASREGENFTWLGRVYPEAFPAGNVMNLLRLLYAYD